MSEMPFAPKKVDVLASARELAGLLKQDPSLLEKDLIEEGNRLLAFYQDANFGEGFQNLRKVKSEVLEMAIQDVAGGVMTLRTSTIGVSFRANALMPFVSPHGTAPSGTVVFSLNWKNLKAFQNWRNAEGADEVDQDQINIAIYRLTAALSALM